MSEIMTVEAILEARWILEKDYWTRTRFPYKTVKGGWSDFDVVAYSPQKGHLVLGEAKAQGTKESVYVTRYSKKGDFQEFLDGIQFKDPYFSFIKNVMEWNELPGGLKDRIFKLNKITFHLVSNWIITLEEQDEGSTVKNGTDALIKALEAKIMKFPFFEKQKDQPIKVELLWNSPMDVFVEILQKERKSGQGRRYGNDVIDLARELNRFRFPSFLSSYGEKLSSSREWKKLLTSQITKSFLEEILSPRR
jgi:hypothetical protein